MTNAFWNVQPGAAPNSSLSIPDRGTPYASAANLDLLDFTNNTFAPILTRIYEGTQFLVGLNLASDISTSQESLHPQIERDTTPTAPERPTTNTAPSNPDYTPPDPDQPNPTGPPQPPKTNAEKLLDNLKAMETIRDDGTTGGEEDGDIDNIGPPEATFSQRMRGFGFGVASTAWFEADAELAQTILETQGVNAFIRLALALDADFEINNTQNEWGENWTYASGYQLEWASGSAILRVDKDWNLNDQARLIVLMSNEVFRKALDTSNDDPNSLGALDRYRALANGMTFSQLFRVKIQQILELQGMLRDELIKEGVSEGAGHGIGRVAELVASAIGGVVAVRRNWKAITIAAHNISDKAVKGLQKKADELNIPKIGRQWVTIL